MVALSIITGKAVLLLLIDGESSSSFSTTSAFILSPLLNTIIFSIKCFNSLTFPGQLYLLRTRIASGVKPLYLISLDQVNSRENLSRNAFISSGRFLNGGTKIETVLSLKKGLA